MAKPRHKFLKQENVVRIIGGEFGGRKLRYLGEAGTRPMKDRTREALFNLIGTELKGKHAIDLFGGTGAMAIEAISRGAQSATVVERHFPMAKSMGENLELLGIQDRVEAITGDLFAWARRRPEFPPLARAIFCCPPYALYEDRGDEILDVLNWLMADAAAGTIVAVEFDERFSSERLPEPNEWDVRNYPPATLAVRRL